MFIMLQYDVWLLGNKLCMVIREKNYYQDKLKSMQQPVKLSCHVMPLAVLLVNHGFSSWNTEGSCECYAIAIIIKTGDSVF